MARTLVQLSDDTLTIAKCCVGLPSKKVSRTSVISRSIDRHYECHVRFDRESERLRIKTYADSIPGSISRLLPTLETEA